MPKTESTPPPVRPSPRTPWWRAAVPWVSLAVGIASALLMDRGPARARLVAVAVGLGWVFMLATLVMRRLRDASSRLHKGAWWSSLMLTQWAIQLGLFFALPFYWRAWAGTLPQLGFLVLLTVAALVSLWDPWTERLLHRPRVAALLPGIACFSALTAALPGLGLSNSRSLWAAAAATSLALPIALVRPEERGRSLRRLWLGTLVAMVLGPAALLAGAARCVPPAPLALVEAEIGTRQRSRGVADPLERLERRPAVLMCATAIHAPLGVRETLYHVWRQNGEVRDRIELDIVGGREAGYRTWSRKHNFGDDPSGLWSCAVETALGQSLGSRTIEVAP